MTEKQFKNVEEKLDWGTIQYFTYNDEKLTDDEIEDLVNQLLEENEQLKQSFTMYYNLFVEFQKQMKGVKKASDLDSKDFEDLIELAKGNVFDDKIGWIHLPVKELEE